MDDITELLDVYYKKIEDVELKDATNDEMMIEGDYWEFIDPKVVEAWSLKMVPHTNNMHFNMKYKNSPLYLRISFDERVKRIANDIFPEIKIHYVTTKNDLPPK